MTRDEMVALMDASDAEFAQFDRVAGKRSPRHDLHAFLLLDELVPGRAGMIACAEHDEIWLDIDPEILAVAISADQVVELVRCGVRFDGSTDSLSMFV